MGSIELRMAILTGAIGGVILLMAEAVALHRKLARYRTHLRGLRSKKRYIRLFAETGSVAVVVLIQPVLVTMLLLSALDRFTPQFSAHVIAQLQQGIPHAAVTDDHPLKEH
jgi:uncharacterized membrane protein